MGKTKPKRKAESGKPERQKNEAAAPHPLAIEYVPRTSLAKFANNARTHSPEQVLQIAASIKEFGFTNPILVRQGTILAGHGRLAASEQLGLETVPVIVLDYLSESQARKLVLADNKIALNSGWDESLLKAELADLATAAEDLSVLGWSDVELKLLLTDEPPAEAKTVDIPATYSLYITLPSETEQKLLYEELSKRGLEIKVLTT